MEAIVDSVPEAVIVCELMLPPVEAGPVSCDWGLVGIGSRFDVVNDKLFFIGLLTKLKVLLIGALVSITE